MHVFGILMGQLVYLAEHFGCPVQGVLALGLGGLEHEGFVDDQWEVHRGRMHAVVDEGLGDVQGGDSGLLLEGAQI